MNSNFLKQCAAEFIGTFALVFASCGAIIVHQLYPQSLSGLAIPLVFGLVIAVMIYSVGHISGAHFNPVVTLAFAVTRHFPPLKVLGYVAAQFLGALFASFLHHIFLSNVDHDFGMTQTVLPQMAALGLEFLFSFFLMFVIMAVATDTRAVGEMAGLAIGGIVAVCAFFGGPLTGASMNPARSLGPALMAGELSGLWVYFLGPLLGAVAGSIVYQKIRCDQDTGSGAAGCC